MFGFLDRREWTVLVSYDSGLNWNPQWIGPGSRSDAVSAARRLNQRPANAGDYHGQLFIYKAAPVNEAAKLGIKQEFLSLSQ